MIDEAIKQHTATQERQARHGLVFPNAAQRLMDAIVAKTGQGVEKINNSVLQEKLRCQLQLTMGSVERLTLWKESFPSINLSVALEVYAHRIKINYSKQEYAEARLRKYDDLFHLRFNDYEEIELLSDGRKISVAKAADYLLAPFLSPVILDKRWEEQTTSD